MNVLNTLSVARVGAATKWKNPMANTANGRVINHAVIGTIRWPRLYPSVGRNQGKNEGNRPVSGLQIR
jgi:hypothetical protein